MKLDAKFDGVIIKSKDASVVPPDQYVVFLAKDDAFPNTLEFYEEECKRLGAAPAQIKAVRALRRRLFKWRSENIEICKVADVEAGELLLPNDG